jgi:hypothetical protein
MSELGLLEEALPEGKAVEVIIWSVRYLIYGLG